MPDLSHEKQCQRDGFSVVAGIDEAGRGPLAGPVSVAAVILPDGFRHPKLNDSKQLSEKVREAIYEEITGDASIAWSSVMVEAGEIDRINILQATWEGMRRAFLGLDPGADYALIDGKPVRDFPAPHTGLVKGDSIRLSIAAASVIAKVERDRLMVRSAEKYPEYGFERHKGYGTKIHREALREHGPCPIHRHSFAPVAEAAALFAET